MAGSHLPIGISGSCCHSSSCAAVFDELTRPTTKDIASSSAALAKQAELMFIGTSCLGAFSRELSDRRPCSAAFS